MNTSCHTQKVLSSAEPQTAEAEASAPHRYPIREFAHLTGVNPATLRAWERRYGIITPHRTPKGHRFYNDQQIDSVRQIVYWLEQGYPIRQVRMLLREPASSTPSSHSYSEQTPQEETWTLQQETMIRTLMDTHQRGLDDLLHQGFSHYPVSVYYQFCILPVLERLRAGHGPNLVLRLFQQWLHRKLEATLHHQQRHQQQRHQQRHHQGVKVIVLATHPDDHTESLIRACALGAAGFHVDCLYSDIGPTDIPLLLQATETRVLWLHFHAALQHPKAAWKHYLAETHTTGIPPSDQPHSDVLTETDLGTADPSTHQAPLICISGAVPTDASQSTNTPELPQRPDQCSPGTPLSLHQQVQHVITQARAHTI